MASDARLGAPTFAFLAFTVVTGIAVTPLYDVAAPLASVEALQGGIPWGWWLRAAHAFAAWGLLGCAVVHVVDVLWRRVEDRVSAAAWWRWTLLLPAVVLALLGGFVLRGDADADAALAVWRGVLGSVPIVGSTLSTFLLGHSGGGVVALHHAGTFTALAWTLSAEHARRPWPGIRETALVGVVVGALAALVPLPLGTGTVRGPWYLLGLQGMLLDLPVAAAWIAPLLGVLALGATRHPRLRPWGVGVLVALSAAWFGWTIRLLVTGG